MSKLGYTELYFVQPGVKVNGDYYHEVLLKEKLLPCIKEISGDNVIFQQDSAPAHTAHDNDDPIALLRRETPDFISPDQWPPNSPDMNPVDYKICAVM